MPNAFDISTSEKGEDGKDKKIELPDHIKLRTEKNVKDHLEGKQPPTRCETVDWTMQQREKGNYINLHM